MGKKGERLGTLFPFIFFGLCGRKRNRIAFRDGVLAIQRLKHYFASNL